MNALLDIILVLLIAVPIIASTKRGFVKSISRVVCVALGIILAITLTPAFTEKINAIGIRDGLHEKIYETVSSIVPDDIEAGEAAVLEGSELNVYLQNLGINIDSMIGEAGDSIDAIVESVSDFVADKLIYALCFLIIYVAVYLLALFVFWVISKIVSLPVLKSFDRFLGFVLGIVIALLMVMLYYTLMNSFLPYLNTVNPSLFPTDIAESTFLYRFLIDYIPTLKF